MVNKTKMMFSRGINCRYCGNGYYGMQHVIDYANQVGLWGIIDVQKENCVKAKIYEEIENHDSASLYHFGHGNDCVTTGDTEQPIWVCGDCANLKDRIIYFMSCLTANGLGPSIINDCGGKSYAGFNVSWTWLSSDTSGDPYEDPAALPFYESANELWIALLQGKTFGEAVQQSYNKYTEWIQIKQAEGDANSVKWLVHDRDSLVGLGDMNAKVCACEDYLTKDECINGGCYWWNGTCNYDIPDTYEDSYDLTINVPPPDISVEVTTPESVPEGFGAFVEYKVTNNGSGGNLSGYLIDVYNDDILEDSYWEKYLGYGDVYTIQYITPPVREDSKFRLEVYLDDM